MKTHLLTLGVVIIIGLIIALFHPLIFANLQNPMTSIWPGTTANVTQNIQEQVVTPDVIHLPTPVPLKGLYMTSWVAGIQSLRNSRVVNLIDKTELNAVVIDIKDYSGRISFAVEHPTLNAVGAFERRIPSINALIKELHDKNIYIIGRISVFQDPWLAKKWPDIALRRASDGGIWADRNGLSWVDPGSKKVWDYNIALAKEAYAKGFDELNFDYVRFASDGNMKNIVYPISQGKPKDIVIESFFSYLSKEMRESTDAVLSADLFGLTTTITNDMNIGQVIEKAAPHFDFICPMVYPSHYPRGFNKYSNPADHPYEIVHYAMTHAVERLSTGNMKASQLRPWLQDFNMGAVYTPAMVRAQIKATYDSGLTSWLLWNAANMYTPGALVHDGVATANRKK